MALQELRVVDQGRRFAKLAGNFAMAIEKLVESRQVPAGDVIAWDRLPILRSVLDSRLDLRGRRLRLRARGTTEDTTMSPLPHRELLKLLSKIVVACCPSHVPPFPKL
jgi:hypothetical protein